MDLTGPPHHTLDGRLPGLIEIFSGSLLYLAVLIAGEWEACGDRFYEKHELYTMAWSDIKLDQMR